MLTVDLNEHMLDAIVFDLDGVLVDSAPCHRAAFEEVFRPLGVHDFDYSRYAGWRTNDVVESVLGRIGFDATPEFVTGLAGRKSQLAREKLAKSNPIDQDCLAVLGTLARSYTLALASSGSRQSVEMFLNTNNCAHLFQSVLCGDSVSKAKPDPEIYERTFDALQIDPGTGAVVEDAVAGIVAAKAAGAGAIIGIAGTCPADQLLGAGASHVIHALAELPELLGSAYGHANAN